MAYTPQQQKQYDQLIAAGADKKSADFAVKQIPTTTVDPDKGKVNRNTGEIISTPSNTTPNTPQPSGGFGLGSFKEQPKSNLLSFANSIDEAINLARKKRNALSLDLMMPQQGTLMASDFNGILGNLNQASTAYASSLTSRALEAAKAPTYSYGTATDTAGNLYQVQYDQNGQMIGQQLLSAAAPQGPQYTEVSPGASLFDPNTGQQVYTAPTAASQKAAAAPTYAGSSTASSGSTASAGGAPAMSSKQVTALKNALNDSKYAGEEADGKYADPNLYLQNYQSWIQAGGSKEEFFRMFPPATYINPENKWLPPEIMQFTKKSSSSSSSVDDDIDNLF